MTDEYPGLAGRVALVTGASRGIGAEISRELASRGVKVVLAGRDREALSCVTDAIRGSGGQAAMALADLTNAGGGRGAAPRSRGRVRNCAAPRRLRGRRWSRRTAGRRGGRHLAGHTGAESYLRLPDAPDLSAANVRVGRGAIVLMSSSAGRHPSEASAAYSAAKAGLAPLMWRAAADGAPHGVGVNTLAPSAIVTERLAAQPAAVRAGIAQTFPLGRLGEVTDVASAALFLLSDAASWITGVTLDIAGGRLML